VPTLGNSHNDSSEEEMEGDVGDINGVRHMYRDELGQSKSLHLTHHQWSALELEAQEDHFFIECPLL
jgi:hypothetical protein